LQEVAEKTVVSPASNQPRCSPLDLVASEPLQVAVVGTDTGVGKTRVVSCLVRGLRARHRRVWLHKPVACGGWDGRTAEDARALEPLRDPDQSAQSLCPFQFPEPASPHLAARAMGTEVSFAQLMAGIDACRPTADNPHDLVVEGIGGLLVPLTAARQSVADLFAAARLPIVVVTRPHLGTLNHTALTIAAARQQGLTVVGLVLNHHTAVDDSLAVRTAATELEALTGVPLLVTLPFTPQFAPHTAADPSAVDLAEAVLARTVRRA
jgi:dethiobiotin synthetase